MLPEVGKVYMKRVSYVSAVSPWLNVSFKNVTAFLLPSPALCWPLSRCGWMSTARTSGTLPYTRRFGCSWITWGSALRCMTACAASPTFAHSPGKLRSCSGHSRKKVILRCVAWPIAIMATRNKLFHNFTSRPDCTFMIIADAGSFRSGIKWQFCFCRSWARWSGVWWWRFRQWKLSGSRWHHGFFCCSHCWTAHSSGLCMLEENFTPSPPFPCCIIMIRAWFGFLDVPGSLCQSGPIPVSGLCMVPARQEGKHVAHHPSHHCTVQCSHQPGHRVAALPAYRWQSHFLPSSSHLASAKGSHHREVDQSSAGQLKCCGCFAAFRCLDANIGSKSQHKKY